MDRLYTSRERATVLEHERGGCRRVRVISELTRTRGSICPDEVIVTLIVSASGRRNRPSDTYIARWTSSSKVPLDGFGNLYWCGQRAGKAPTATTTWTTHGYRHGGNRRQHHRPARRPRRTWSVTEKSYHEEKNSLLSSPSARSFWRFAAVCWSSLKLYSERSSQRLQTQRPRAVQPQ